MSELKRISWDKVIQLPGGGGQATGSGQRPLEGASRTAKSVTDVGLSDQEILEIRKAERRKAYEAFAATVVELQAAQDAGKVDAVLRDGHIRHPQYEAMVRAYQHMRLVWVPPRKRLPRRAKGEKPRHDPTLDRWRTDSEAFRVFFYGPGKGKRTFIGVNPERAEVIQTYAKLRNKWRKKTPEYRAYQAKYQQGYRARKRGSQ